MAIFDVLISDPNSQYRKGMQHYNNGKYYAAVDLFEKAAEQGNAQAQYMLGLCYQLGNGVTQDNQHMIEYYKEAAGQQNADAENALGLLYQDGKVIAQDKGKALDLWIASATKGNTKAIDNIKIHHSQEFAEKLVAATKGDSEAQFFVGAFYYNRGGYYVDQNINKAAEWWSMADKQNNSNAQNGLGELCYYKYKDYKQAVLWYTKASNNGHHYAQNSLGELYYNGHGVEQNQNKAFDLWMEAFLLDNQDALANLKRYCKDEVIIKAVSGDAAAQNLLGNRYYFGKNGLVKNLEKSVMWYKKSAGQDNAWGCRNLGMSYYNGKGVEQDYNKAFALFIKADKIGGTDANNWLAYCYAYGYGTSKNFSKAIDLWFKEAETGEIDIKGNIAMLCQSLQNDKNQIQNNFNALNLNYNKLRTDNSKLTDENSRLTTENNNLKSANNNLYSSHQSAGNDIDWLKKENAELKKKVEIANDEIRSLKWDNDKVKDELNSVRRTYGP